MKKIVITGGHHSSALPVINEIKKRYPLIEIFWFGHKHTLLGSSGTTLEFREITALGIPFYDIKAGKIYKTYNLLRLIKIPVGFIQAFFLLLKLKPDLILSFGGYLAVPVVISGKLLGIRSITHEQTVVIGYANKLLSKVADKVLYTWPSSEKYLPQGKCVQTGIPLRENIFHSTTDVFDVSNGLPTIYITGGKTGSHKINLAIKEILPELLNQANVIHQCGEHSEFNDFEKLSDKYLETKDKVKGRYYVEKFILSENIGEVFGKSVLIISRAGAHICYELIALEKPSILIPIPWVSHNEQMENAKMLNSLGLSEIYLEADLENCSQFISFIKNTLSKVETYILKDKNLIIKNSEKIIVDEIAKLELQPK